MQDEKLKLQEQVEAKQDTLRVIQALKPQLEQLRQELVASQHKLDSLKSIFPDQKEIPKLIREITSVARASGITTTKFNPMPDVVREYYVENKYNLSIDGGYHELANFFAFLANFTLIINLSDVQITGLKGYKPSEQIDPENVQILSIKATFNMTTFSSKK
jgi:type IV pilus assembly protein PilO